MNPCAKLQSELDTELQKIGQESRVYKTLDYLEKSFALDLSIQTSIQQGRDLFGETGNHVEAMKRLTVKEFMEGV